MAELFEDHSALQLGASGKVDAAVALRLGPVGAGQPEPVGSFMLVGRLQYRYQEGAWNEWHLLFDSSATAWLSEDNGRYALTRDLGLRADLPQPQAFAPGKGFRLDGQSFQIASVTQASLIAAAGELPFVPQLNTPFWLVDARASDGRIATLDFSDSEQKARVYVGTGIELSALAMAGLKEQSSKSLAARTLSCPNCGAAVEVKLDGSKSVTCGSCASLIDLSKQGDAALEFTKQQQRFTSPIPLGSQGSVDGVDWQAVGFARRSAVANDGEQFSWSEVLLYNRIAGFAFVVVATDGISLVRSVQDLPGGPGWNSIRYRDKNYKAQPAYRAVVDYVEGEFYWQVRIGQQTRNIDYNSGDWLLSREESVSKESREVVWSHGKKYPAAELAKTFGLPDIEQYAAGQGPERSSDLSDSLTRTVPSSVIPSSAIGGAAAAAAAAPTSGSIGIVGVIIIVIVILILIAMLSDCNGGSGSGSSSGGYSGGSGRGYSGGSHK